MRLNGVGPSRREFLGALLASGAVAAFGAPAVAGRGMEAVPEDAVVIVQTSFEKGEPLLEAGQHKVVKGMARTGSCSLRGVVDGANEACIVEIPFETQQRSILHVSFWVRSDEGSACAVWVRANGERLCAGRMEKVAPGRWRHVYVTQQLEEPVKGVLEIVAPSSHSAPAGQAWIDDVTVALEPLEPLEWPEHVVDFPALTPNGAGGLWLAMVERSGGRRYVGVYGVEGTEAVEAVRLEPEGLTGLGAPAIAGWGDGCVVAFPVEKDGCWRIGYSFVGGGYGAGRRYLGVEGSTNISPAIGLAGSKACVVWESNGGDGRGIYAAWVDGEGAGKAVRLSAADGNSSNPAVVALPDGSLFAAWDSVREGCANIYGAWFRDGRWGKERRITEGTRIERHPALAVRGDEVWMAWQAQSYVERRINNVNEQLVAVARVGDDGLMAPKGLFEEVSTAERLLMRPRIGFDGSGRLWLVARESLGLHSGWRAVAWSYGAEGWSKARTLMKQQGRWRGAPVAAGSGGMVTAVQYDDLPRGWEDRGVWPDWKSGMKMKACGDGEAGARAGLALELLAMPETEFSVKAKMALCAAELPRQRWKRPGGALTLFWGDFHDHTDLSVCVRSMNPPGVDLFANERDIERLDFCALTDHGYNFDPPQWQFNGEQTREYHDPGRFVTFLGQEWTSSKNPPAEAGKPNRYGHRNLIFLDPHHARFYDSFDGDISPGDLWGALKGTEFICIPHQLADWQGKGKGNPPTDWSFVDERLQPVAEIFQARQSYEYLGCPRQARLGAPFKGYYLQDAWAEGIVIGVIASPDHGGGQGKAGVWARELTREGIFEAVRARHTFGTSGAKMALRFGAGEAMMGDVVQRGKGRIAFEVEALALCAIREVVIFRNNEVVYRAEPGKKRVEVAWSDGDPPDVERLWYYARVQGEDEELAWSSPMWFVS